MPILYKNGVPHINLEQHLKDLSEKCSSETYSHAKSNAPVYTGAYRDGIQEGRPTAEGYSILGSEEHSAAVEFRWNYNTLNNAVRKALKDNGVKLI